MVTQDWLTNGEPEFYLGQLGADPYAIWVSYLDGITPKRRAARLLAFADKRQRRAHIIYLDGSRDVVFAQQMTGRHPLEPTSVSEKAE